MKIRQTAVGSADHDQEVRVWVDLDGGWAAFLRIAAAPGWPVAELRVFPMQDWDTDPAVWPEAWSGAPAEVPGRGVPARGLRGIRLQDVQEHVQACVQRWSEEGHPAVAQFGGDDSEFWSDVLQATALDRRSVKKWTTPQRLALLAADYVQLCDAREPYPNRALAELWGRTPSQITSDIYNARHRHDLLTKAPRQGEAGGRLTAKAKGILERLEKG